MMKLWIGRLASVCLSALLAMPTAALEQGEAGVGAMEPVGSARMRVLLWDLYDATLYAPEGQWPAAGSYALELAYLRDLQGAKIADRSITEIRGQGFADEPLLAQWGERLLNIIPDVREGDRILGAADERGVTRFFLNGEQIGQVEDPAFATAFFGIWLSENTSEPKLRTQLLGGKS